MPKGNPNPSTRFAKGNTHAADNQNQAKKRIRKSKLRKTLEKLYALEGKAMENIKASVDGAEVDKEMLATSKWVVTNIMTVTKAAAQDEAEINGLRLEMDKAEAEEQEKEEVQQPSGAVFSLFVNEAKRDKE